MIHSVMIKPVGDLCNLRCSYCYYRGVSPARSDKQLLAIERVDRMLPEWLGQGSRQIAISFQGGEPTLAGLKWFEDFFAAVDRYRRADQNISLALQTNGLLIDKAWAKMLAAHRVLVGLSIDGPEPLHDKYRRNAKAVGSFKNILKAGEFLLNEGAAVNVMVLLNDGNVRDPEGLYSFLKRQGFQWLQFIPCVEWDEKGMLHPFCVTPQAYGKFLVELLEAWYRQDVGRIFVRHFESMIIKLAGMASDLCYFEPYCNPGLTVEHEGSVYGCAHFVRKEWYLGSVDDSDWLHWDKHPRYLQFARQKAKLPSSCLSCPNLELCGGGCQKHRHPRTGENVLCLAYKRFFATSLGRLKGLVSQLQSPNL